MARDFANRFVRNLVAGFAGDLAPADPMAAGTTFDMALRRTDDGPQSTRRFQGYFRTSVVGLTCTMQLWIHGAGTDWIAVGPALAAVPANTLFQVTGQVADALAFVQVTPSAALAGVDTLDVYLEETE